MTDEEIQQASPMLLRVAIAESLGWIWERHVGPFPGVECHRCEGYYLTRRISLHYEPCPRPAIDDIDPIWLHNIPCWSTNNGDAMMLVAEAGKHLPILRQTLHLRVGPDDGPAFATFVPWKNGRSPWMQGEGKHKVAMAICRAYLAALTP